ncbi:hypothetical protein CAPTEDRAFT_193114 [Capitella teleta]|uniref:G-protein coupled receptors family 1 profile domain-containing protein n=1 Tax=Capitella teleta TaxID=283909 RepID=R7UNE1_CAPTE|nr:hypothetical protein CAPTEDRAFT_193114 [Capitella teleta]|eukprot:ELU07745.1 hypothetical protein CAPTEDRAFT_193114 [Capitella teleta]
MSEATGNVSANFTSGTIFVGSQNYWVYLVSVSSVNALMNLLLLIAILVTKLDRGSNRFIFIGDLAFGALVVGIANFYEGTNELLQGGLTREKLCLPVTILTVVGLYEANLNLMALVVDQYMVIAYPLRYHTLFSRKRAWIVSFSIFGLVVAISVSTALLWTHNTTCDYITGLPWWHHCINFIAMLITPLVLIVILQVLTIRISRRHMRQIRNSGVCDSTSEESMLRRHWTGVITNTLICVALILTWTPLIVIFGINIVFPGIQSMMFAKFFNYAMILYVMYGIWVPTIYSVRSPQGKTLWNRLKARYKNRQRVFCVVEVVSLDG